MAAPVFTRQTTSLQNYIKKLPGSSLLLPCEALGSPRPSLTWLHEGRTLDSDPILSITSLTQSHSGVYTCLASNLLGSARTEFSVTVESPRVELPSISRVTNSSCGVGETAVLQCKVQSSLPASVQWLRRLEPGEVVGQVEESSSLSLAGMHLVSVAGETDSARTVSLGEGRYLDTLVIHQVEERHAGLYVCFATNTAGGLNYQTAHLEVVTAEDQVDQVEEQGQEEQLFLGLVVGLVAVVLVLLITIFLCLIKTRQKRLVPNYCLTDPRRGMIYQQQEGEQDTLQTTHYSLPPDTVNWSSLQKSPLPPYAPSSRGSNIYDQPFCKPSTGVRLPRQKIHYSPLPLQSPAVSHSHHSPLPLQSPAVSRISRMTSLPPSSPTRGGSLPSSPHRQEGQGYSSPLPPRGEQGNYYNV